jgi:radical SAM superfamily enzyme YgiQ (UPF0313 family)
MVSKKRIPIYLVYRSFQPGLKQVETRLAYPPLALGMIVNYALTFEEVRSEYEVVARVISTEDAMREAFDEYGPGVYLVSNYIWSSRGNMSLSALAKQLSPRSITVHGGPNTPKYERAAPEYLAQHEHADVLVRAEGEATMADLLPKLAEMVRRGALDPDVLAGVPGITFRVEGGAPVRTPDRERVRDLDVLPSPYLNGFFDGFNKDGWAAAIQETNRGCPYGCTFCDWGSATLQKIYHFSLDRVREEVGWFARNKIAVVFCADANFGMFDRDVEIAEAFVKAREAYGYPKQLEMSYAKNATKRLTQIIAMLNRGGLATQGNLAIQTHDPEVLKNIARSNIKTERYDELLAIFRSEGLQVSSDLIVGLPGQTVESFRRDIQFFIDRRVFTMVRELLVLPNSPMADPDYLERFGMKLDKRGVILETSALPPEGLAFIRWVRDGYSAFFACGMLKHYLYWLQLEHGIEGQQVLADLALELRARPEARPVAHRILFDLAPKLVLTEPRKQFIDSVTEAQWRAFYEEITSFVRERYGVERDSAAEAQIEAQVALMPRTGRTFPYRVELPHDVVAYFAQVKRVSNLRLVDRAALRPLADFGPGELVVTDPGGLCSITAGRYLNDLYSPQWELQSALSIDDASVSPSEMHVQQILDKRRTLPVVNEPPA